jgi:hypothetical protein
MHCVYILQSEKFPRHAREIVTYFGVPGYNGPCPPEGSDAHHYHFALYALDTEKIELTPDMMPNDVVNAIRSNTIDRVVLTGLYKR